MKVFRTNPYKAIVNEFLIDSPAPVNINYFYNLGSLQGLNQVILIITGISLAKHYNPSVELAFSSSEHIVRDVNNGYLLRYIHANGVSLFFMQVYVHIGKGLYYGSYRAPRRALWIVGVLIFIIKKATAFIGYVLIWGQKSFWGKEIARNGVDLKTSFEDYTLKVDLLLIKSSYIISTKRIGPHNEDIYNFLVGSLLGDGHLEKHGNGSRLCLQQESSNKAYLLWSHEYLSSRGYCSEKVPAIQERIGNNGKRRYVLRLKTWTYANLNFQHDEFYTKNIQDRSIKVLSKHKYSYLSPLSLAIWIKDDGARSGQSLKLCTNNFTYVECLELKQILESKYLLKISIHKTGVIGQYNQYIHKASKNKLNQLISPYIHPSMKYKIGNEHLI